MATSPSRPRYPSDLTDAQWSHIEPLLPAARPAGRPEKHPRRDVVNAILYLVRTGCAWRLLPKYFPPWETVYWHFARWVDDGSLQRAHDALRDQVRDRSGRAPIVSAAVVDAQSVWTADTVASESRGFDAFDLALGVYPWAFMGTRRNRSRAASI